MARYIAIKNGVVHSIANFDKTPTNTKDVTYIDFNPNYRVGEKYDVETDTFTPSLRPNSLTINTTVLSNEVLETNNWDINSDILVGLYTTGSEGEVDNATTSSITITFNKDIEPISEDSWEFGGGIVTNYTTISNGCTFDIKFLDSNEGNLIYSKRIKALRHNIKDLEGNILPNQYLTSYNLDYFPILSGSINL